METIQRALHCRPAAEEYEDASPATSLSSAGGSAFSAGEAPRPSPAESALARRLDRLLSATGAGRGRGRGRFGGFGRLAISAGLAASERNRNRRDRRALQGTCLSLVAAFTIARVLEASSSLTPGLTIASASASVRAVGPGAVLGDLVDPVNRRCRCRSGALIMVRPRDANGNDEPNGLLRQAVEDERC